MVSLRFLAQGDRSFGAAAHGPQRGMRGHTAREFQSMIFWSPLS